MVSQARLMDRINRKGNPLTLFNLLAPDGPIMLAVGFYLVYKRGKLDMLMKVMEGPKFKSWASDFAIGLTLVYSAVTHLFGGPSCWGL